MKFNFLIRYFLFFATLIFSNYFKSQNNVDSLIDKLKIEKNSIKQITLCSKISNLYARNSNTFNKSIFYINKASKINSITQCDSLWAHIFISKADIYLVINQSTNDSSDIYFDKLKSIEKTMSTKTKLSYYTVYGKYLTYSDQDLALTYLLKAEKIAKENKIEKAIISIKISIAIIYQRMEKYFESNAILLSIPVNLCSESKRESLLNNIIQNYIYLRNDSCLFYATFVSRKNPQSFTFSKLHIADYLFRVKKEYVAADKLLDSLKEEFIFNTDINTTNQLPLKQKLELITLSTLIKSKKNETEGNITNKNKFLYQSVNEFKNLLKLCNLQKGKDLDSYGLCHNIQLQLSLCYEKLKQPDSALYYYKQVAISDSILAKIKNDESAKQLIAKYDSEKKEAQIKLLNEQNKFSKSENSKQRIIVIGSLLVALLFLAGLLTYANRNRIKRKANELLSTQKQIIERTNIELNKRNTHIQDSIEYASVIQKSILTNENSIKQHIKNYFILYQPKEAVGGDFYWFYKTPNTNSYYIALADCTGHGVPGSLMTLLCTSILNQIVEQQPNLQPAQLLNLVNTKLYNSFTKENTEKRSKEGMDITVLNINLDNNKLMYSGARNPIILITKNEEVKVLEVNRYTVGNQANYEFEHHEMQLKETDTLYLFTDGFVDQKGGQKNFKLLKSNFIKLLQSIHSNDMLSQKEYLLEYFTNWKAQHEQIDDVSVIGLRV
jgi:serine phosphatase RsbU (regulator of sigma subunit)